MNAVLKARTALLSFAAVIVCAAAPAEQGTLVLDSSGPPGSLLLSAQGAEVSIKSRLTIDHLAGGRWKEVETHFDAISRCYPLPPPCISVEVGRPLRVIRWAGLPCAGQCDGMCVNNWRDPGQYRFTAATCDGKIAYHSRPFILRGVIAPE